MEYLAAFGVLYLLGSKVAAAKDKAEEIKARVQTKQNHKGLNSVLNEYQRDDFEDDVLVLNEFDREEVKKMGIVLGDPATYRNIDIPEDEDDILNEVATIDYRHWTRAHNDFV